MRGGIPPGPDLVELRKAYAERLSESFREDSDEPTMARCSGLNRLVERGAALWSVVRKSYIFILITWHFITKKRRVTRQVLFKTSVASILVAVFTFLAAYSAVFLLASPTEPRRAVKDVPSEHRRGRLLWSSRGRSRLHSRYQGRAGVSEKAANGELKTPPSPDWGYNELVNNITFRPPCPTNAVLLIIITSAPGNRAQRKQIRQTWCSQRPPMAVDPLHAGVWRCVFLLGETRDEAQNVAIRAEAHAHGDMLIGRFSDSYRNLTYKVITGFHWAVYECQPKFVLKTDDDCFVNVAVFLRLLVHMLRTQDVSGMYVGNVFLETSVLRVIRDPVSKWAVSREEYAPDLYPQYASGTGYVLSLPAARLVLKAGQSYMPFPNEDAYMGVLAESVGIAPQHSHRFTFVNSQWVVCNFLYLLVIHRVSLQDQSDYYDMTRGAASKCGNQPFYDTWN